MALFVALSAAVVVAADDRACAWCHSDTAFVEQSAATAHSAVECNSCHAPAGRAEAVGVVVRHAVPSAKEGRALSAVADDACVSCHADVLKKVVESAGIRIQHADCAQAAECSDCHSMTAHGEATSWPRRYEMETCLECHTSEANLECDLCHAERGPEQRVSSGTFAVTHGPQWEQTHGMGDVKTCTACHTATNCSDCHGAGVPHDPEFLQSHPDYVGRRDARCSSCHEERFCDNCHGLEMPHPAGFTPQHAKAAEADERLCRRCHAETDCQICHERHVHPGGAIDPNAGAVTP